MLTTELPPELWQRIALHLPWKTLENVKFVNKLFYEVATNRFLSCLDLAIPPPQAEIELFHKLDSSAEVRRRLKLASEKPHLIKALRLPLRISSDGIYHSHQLHLPFLYPPAFASAETLLRPFLSLAPSFAELHRIHIIDYENSGPIESSAEMFRTYGFHEETNISHFQHFAFFDSRLGALNT
ncbi:hypothetical protein DL96DRAFT_878053 [Flagelloscypha sp. PMI_526]|nr:hypothetical protein DL96DRAFT_878053 [Flagelloscypha sp. PMI_526]